MRGLSRLASFPIANSLVIVHLRLVFVPPDFILDDCQLLSCLAESILRAGVQTEV